MADPSAQVPVILRRPFLVTSNALINCRNLAMKLSFGKMTVELNIFNVCKKIRDDDNDFEEAVFVGTIVQETLVDSLDSNLLEIMFPPRGEVVDNFMDDPIFHISESNNLESLESCIAHFLISNDPSLWGITNAFLEPTMKG